MKIFFPGQKVPAWLQKIEPSNAHLTFANVVMVYENHESFVMKNLIGNHLLMEVRGLKEEEEDVSIYGQKPKGKDGDIIMDLKPIMTWPGFLLASCIILMLLN